MNITIQSDNVTDGGLTLRGHPTLDSLTLHCPKVTARAFEQLATIPTLRALRIESPSVNDDLCTIVTKCRKLYLLSITGAHLGERGILAIGNMRNLSVLELTKVRFDVNPIPMINKLELLEGLLLNKNPQVTDEWVAMLKPNARLKGLSLSVGVVSDKAIGALSQWSDLKDLMIWQTRITLEGVVKLSAALPKTTIHSEHMKEIRKKAEDKKK